MRNFSIAIYTIACHAIQQDSRKKFVHMLEKANEAITFEVFW